MHIHPCHCMTPLDHSVAVGTTSTPLLGPSEHRRAIILSAPQLNRYSVSFGGTAVLAQGVTMYPGQAPLLIDYAQWGESVKMPMNAIFDTTGETLGFTELIAVD